MKGIKGWWKKRKDEKAAKKQAKVLQKQQGPGVYEDKHLTGKATPLGTDTANRVYGTDTKSDLVAPGGETGGFFKPDQDMAPAKNAVGASKLAKGIGMDDIIPDTRFAKLKTGQGKGGKELGALSKKVEGEALTDNIFDTDVTERVRREDGSLPEREELGDFKKRKGDKVMEFSGSEVNDMDLSRPETQSGLNRLQWFDALIGNTDRHGGNILVDPETGKVSGIDNDLSFGRGISGSDDEKMQKGDGGKFIGLPDLIDEETSQQLMGLDDAKIRSLLTQKSKEEQKLGQSDTVDFTEDEIEDTIKRLEKIQDKIVQLQKSGGVVKKWDQSTYDLQVQNASRGKDWRKNELPSSYVGRQHLNLGKAQDTSVDWQWRKGHRTEDTTPAPKGTAPVPTDDTKDTVVDTGARDDVAPQVGGPGTDDAKSPTDDLLPQSVQSSDSGDETSEEEKEEVAKLVGEPMSTDDALAYIDNLLAELDSLTTTSVDEGKETEGEELQPPVGGMPPLPQRPPVPNTPSGGGEQSDEEKDRKARFRAAMEKFANV